MNKLVLSFSLLWTASGAVQVGADEAGCKSAAMATAGSIRSEGGKSVLKRLYSDEDKWDEFLDCIATGQQPWLHIASELLAVADAGASSDLKLALGDALEVAATDVLRIMTNPSGADDICGEIGVKDGTAADRKDALTRVSRRVDAVTAVKQVELARNKAACLDALGRLQRSLSDGAR